MHGCDWGVDLSLWWGPINGCVQNLNPSFHRRHLLMSHVAGAHTIAVEGVDILLGPNSTLSPLAAALDDYGAFLLKHPSRPNPDVPVAIMIAADQGKSLQPHHPIPLQTQRSRHCRLQSLALLVPPARQPVVELRTGAFAAR